MTIREVYELTKEDGLECLLAVSGISRSAWQGEASTFNGDCGTALKILNTYNDTPGEAAKAFVDALGPAADVDIPDELICQWLEDAEEDE